MDTNFGHRPHRIHGGIRIFLWIIFGIFITLFFAAAISLLVQALWNWLMPGLFGLKTLTYLQALGITILGKLIFGSMGGGSPQRHMMRRFAHEHGENGWNHKEGWGRWKYYNQYWKEEGKAAFENYLEKREAAHPNEPKNNPDMNDRQPPQ